MRVFLLYLGAMVVLVYFLEIGGQFFEILEALQREVNDHHIKKQFFAKVDKRQFVLLVFTNSEH